VRAEAGAVAVGGSPMAATTTASGDAASAVGVFGGTLLDGDGLPRRHVLSLDPAATRLAKYLTVSQYARGQPPQPQRRRKHGLRERTAQPRGRQASLSNCSHTSITSRELKPCHPQFRSGQIRSQTQMHNDTSARNMSIAHLRHPAKCGLDGPCVRIGQDVDRMAIACTGRIILASLRT